MPSFAVRNFGCRVNQAEAFAWADAFRARGLRLDEAWGRSDVVVVNSCALTGRAERDVRKFIRAVHRENSQARIVVTGCYAERAPGEIVAMPGVAAVLPQSAKGHLAESVLAIQAADGPSVAAPPGLPDAAAPMSRGCSITVSLAKSAGGETDPSFRARGWVKVQDGCDDRCTFCIIPQVRGRSRSVPAAEIAGMVRDLADRGFREIVLAGIHLSSYGEDLEPPSSLGALLGDLSKAAGQSRLRLSSLDPRKTDGPLLARLAGDSRICAHFHFSLQHASPGILGLMGRPVRPGSYETILRETARLAPDAAIGADIMVGFPGETGADFEELKAFVERSPLTYAHVFSYSPRPGTPAAGRPPVKSAVVTERAKSLRRLAAMKDFAFRRRFIGRELEGVIIDRTEKGVEVLTGNFLRVIAPDSPVPVRENVRVAIRKVLPRRTEGEIMP